MLTVGASSHMGTVDRSDDTIATFSSRGPTAVDARAKPDIVAPGVGIESLARSGQRAVHVRGGVPAERHRRRPRIFRISVSAGTSMAAPVVSGTVALMLQANPALTPNEVKAILQYTAADLFAVRPADGRRRLPQRQRRRGAGALSRRYRRPGRIPFDRLGEAALIWGNRLVRAAG